MDENHQSEKADTEIPQTAQPPQRSFFRRIFHWGPLIAITIIGTISINSLYCHLQWWPPGRSFAGLLDMLIFLLWNVNCLTNLMKAAHDGPGYVPLKWKPKNKSDEEKLQFCKICDGYKVPRSHHCRKCNRCVMKMDHHCPWINNCCGYGNQALFVQFLFWAVIGCIHATLILGPSIYHAIFRVWYMYYGTGKEPIVELGIYALFGAIFAFGLAVGVVVSVGFLFCIQMRSILRNRTGIEDYIVSKAMHRQRDTPFVYPYDLGRRANFNLVFNWDGRPGNDGIFWPVVDGCDQFTFTIEQIKQKEEKREHAVRYAVVKDYDGSIFFSFRRNGCKAHCCQPMTEESRLKLNVGDHVLVTRWRRHWLYGESSNPGTPPTAIDRGWFPRRCVVELVDDETDNDQISSADPAEPAGQENHVKSD